MFKSCPHSRKQPVGHDVRSRSLYQPKAYKITGHTMIRTEKNHQRDRGDRLLVNNVS